MQMLCFAEPFCRRRQNTMSGVRSKKPIPPFQLMPQEQCCKPINCCFILCPQRGHFLLFFPIICSCCICIYANYNVLARHSLDSATDKIFPHISHSSSSPHDHAVFCLVLRASVLSLCFLHHCNLIINFFNLPFKAQDCLFFKLSQQQKLLLFGQSPAF